jgi:hypothetical protein
MNEPMVEATLRDAVSTVETLPPPLDGFRDLAAHEQRRRRRRTWRGTAAGVAVVLCLAATWAGMRPSDEGATTEARALVTMVENPADIAWWADGALHLSNVTVAFLPADRPIDHLAEINGGAVYGEDTGAIVFVGDDGKVARIGTKAPGAPLVASDESGWVTWVDPRFEPPRLVVYDLTAREVLERRTLPGGGTRQAAIKGSYPIALDLDKVYYAAEDGEQEWTVPDGRTEPVEPPGLLAVAGGTRVWQVDPTTIRMVQPFFSISFDRPGAGAQMSPDGTRVLTHSDRDGEGGTLGTVHLYDTRSGDPLWTGLTRQDIPVAATLGPETEISYLIVNRDAVKLQGHLLQSSGAPYELRTCDHEAHRCRVITRLSRVEMTPVLAR